MSGDDRSANAGFGPRPELGRPDRNFTITGDSIAPATDTAKIQANIAAIRLLKQLEGGNRNLTVAEKATLAAYTGWGAFKEAFNSKYESDIATHWDGKDQRYMPDWLQSWQRNHRPLHQQLKESMTEEEFASASASTLNAHYTQCHFFAGIGGWSYALELAGWPPENPVWTGSCPCQPFSVAVKQLGKKDPRHLWPAFRRLVGKCRPPTVFGEQVASKPGRHWLNGVLSNLERLGYAGAGVDLCAAGVGAPHIRQRLYWVANTDGGRCEQRDEGFWPVSESSEGSAPRGMGLPDSTGRSKGQFTTTPAGHGNSIVPASDPRGMAHTPGDGGTQQQHQPGRRPRRGQTQNDAPECSRPCGVGDTVRDGLRVSGGTPANKPYQSSHWALFDTIACRDGTARRIEPGSFPLANGVPGRVGLLRGYGNAIVPQEAALFILAASELIPNHA